MFVKLISDVAAHKAGSVIDEPNETVARGYIAAGLAEESDHGAHLGNIVDSKLAAATAPILEAVEKLKRSLVDNVPSKGAPPPPAEDKGVEFDGDVEATESPADRGVDGKAIARGFGEIVGLIGRTAPSIPVEHRTHADQRLTEFYKLDRVSDFHDANLSKRGAPVSRAGTESMVGGSGYGYFVKPELMGSYFEIAMEDSLIEPFVAQIPVGATNEAKWLALDQYFIPGIGQTASASGIRVFRKGEITQRASSDAVLREILFKIADLTGITSLSRDLIADNYISAASTIQNLFMRALAFTKDFEFINGDGVGKPTGIRKSNALLTATRKSANKIQLEDLQAMQAIFHQSRAKSSMYIAHQSCFTELLTLKFGSGLPAFLPNASIDQTSSFSLIAGTSSSDTKFQSHGTLLGKPIRFTTDKLEVLGTVGDIMLVDPSQYGVADRQGVEIGVSDQFQFDTDQITYRFKLRNDGKSLWTGPYNSTSPSGANYKTSPYVQLGAGS